MIADSHKSIPIKINQQSVQTWIYGDFKKPLIFFIHGYFRGFSDYVGDLPMRHLRNDFCVVAFDLPGFGKSKEINIDRLEFLELLITKIAKKRTYFLFGLSYGGLLAIKYAVRAPSGLKGLIVGGMPYFFGIKGLIKLLYFIPILKNKNLSQIIKEFSFLNRRNLSRISVSTLLLYSYKDTKATAEMGKRLNNDLPDSNIFLINKYDHSWLMHNIKESGFLEAINKFVAKLDEF